MPKELMLFVKNMALTLSALPTHAPDLDLIGLVMEVATYFATTHGARIMGDVGIDPRSLTMDANSVRQGLGLPSDMQTFTARDMQQRRDLILRRMRGRDRG